MSERRPRQYVRHARVQYLVYCRPRQGSVMAECSYPPGEVCPIRMLEGRPGLHVLYFTAQFVRYIREQDHRPGSCPEAAVCLACMSEVSQRMAARGSWSRIAARGRGPVCYERSITVRGTGQFLRYAHGQDHRSGSSLEAA